MQHTTKAMIAEELRVATKRECAERQPMFVTSHAYSVINTTAGHYVTDTNLWPATSRTIRHMYATHAKSGGYVLRISTFTAPCMRTQRSKGDDLTVGEESG